MQNIKEINFRKEGKQLLKDYALIVLGTFLAALSLPLFFLPYDIAPGGISGISTVLASVLPLSVGLISFVLNVPLFLIGWRTVGWRFAVRSFIAMSLMSLFIDLVPVRDVSGNVMLASVFGGVLLGVGLGLVVRAGATTGGTDMAAKMIHSRVAFLPIAAILFLIDGLVVAVAALAFGLQAALWALIALFVSSQAMDSVIKGFNTAMQFMIISRDAEEIVRRIHTEIDRGCTRLMAEGTYSRLPVGTLLCVVSRTEAPRLKKLVAEVDPQAFVTVCNVHEALGEGFTGIDDE
ncbi:MAG: YitT family protein [Clostridiales bacterium]|nr:YitT family protein [Clostridiales bacterium]MDY3764089.1 YitT family protein [Candidatus Ventricola sp.]MCI6588896.1 YitT family protein [Clostridiales bacterium]MDY3833418.1 YitT family protein [Candidatus Ventricola sp.]MDY4542205.1 YitT family protein [Candidatus Ventricola sp.]